MPLAALAPAWHDFFAIIGTAAATLIGAMFVVVSLGIGFLTRERSVAIRTFLTPTVTHMSTVLLGCALTMVPGLDGNWFAAISGLGGLAGIAYSGQVIWGFNQHEGTGHDDWFWYAIFPLAGYALLLAAACSRCGGELRSFRGSAGVVADRRHSQCLGYDLVLGHPRPGFGLICVPSAPWLENSRERGTGGDECRGWGVQ